MNRISPVSQPQGEAVATLTAIHHKLGMVPNLYATIAHSPTVLNAYLTFNEALGKGHLTSKQRELIALTVGQTNQCQYCISAHTIIAGSVGINQEQVIAARQGKASNTLDQAILTLAKQLVEQRGELRDDQLNSARKHGIDDELIIEVLAQVVVNTFTNYANHVAKTEIDFPEVDLHNLGVSENKL